MITQAAIILIEAKIQKYMEGLSKLPVYQSLVSDTPELMAWRGLPVIMRLLIPTRIDWVESAAYKMRIQVVAEAPEWILSVWEERDKYWTKPLMDKREERKQKLREAGFE